MGDRDEKTIASHDGKTIAKIRYSRDKYLKALTLSAPLKRLGEVVYEETNGEGILEFINQGIVYREEDWSYLIARLLTHKTA